MAEFNPTDNDFTCPLLCAFECILTGPTTCIKKLAEGSCVHPVAAEVKVDEAKLGLLEPAHALRMFSSVFQQELFIAEDQISGEVYMCIKDEEGQLVPINGPITAIEPEQASFMADMQEMLDNLPTTDGPVL